jgi:hypothetical protein
MDNVLITGPTGVSASVDAASMQTLIGIIETIMDSGDVYPFCSDDYSKVELDNARSAFEVVRGLIDPIDCRIRRIP